MIEDVAHVIQLATAPVFLVMGVGSLLSVLTGRLGRVFDRARVLEKEQVEGPTPARGHAIRTELRALVRRARSIYVAIALAASCALVVTVLIALAFVSAITKTELSTLIAILFVVAMVAFSSAIAAFLYEVYVASTTLKLRIDVDEAAPSVRASGT